MLDNTGAAVLKLSDKWKQPHAVKIQTRRKSKMNQSGALCFNELLLWEVPNTDADPDSDPDPDPDRNRNIHIVQE